MKDSLSSFLPNLPGVIDTPGSQDNSSLRGLIEKPPGKLDFLGVSHSTYRMKILPIAYY